MNELKKIAPELSKIKKEVPFDTPKNYFDDFSARLHLQIEAEKQNTTAPQKHSIIRLLKPALGLAASFAIIFMLVYVPLKTFLPFQSTEVAQSTTDLDSGILNYIEGIDESSFVSLLNESEDTYSVEFSDEELTLYVSANFSDYEIYENLENQ